MKYIVEMMATEIEGFEKRAQYYAANTYCAHFGKRGKYHDLKKVIFLAITDYIVFPKKDYYKSDHVILDDKSHENDLQDFSFTFVELPKFTKTIDQLKTIEDQWYYFLKHAGESNYISEPFTSNPEIAEAYEILDRFNWTQNEIQWYEKIIMNTADTHGMLATARSEGFQEGLRQRLQKMLKRNHPIEEIAEDTGLSVEEIQKLTK